MATQESSVPPEAAQTEPGSDDDPHAHAHPSERDYVKIALILAVVTAAEVGVYYVPALRSLLVPILLAMALVKFALVALWFMHLRFDSRLFRRLFVTGIVLAVACYMVVLTTFHVWTR